MTEKQFKCHLAVVGVHIGVGTDERELTGDECRDLLNELSTENRQLKQLQNELYDFRMVYNALLFNNWHKHNEIEVYKSRRHNDGTFIYEWFIVVAILPDGKQVTNHYHIKYWDYFKIPEYTMVKDKFDGHTSQDVLDRLKSWLNE